MHHCNIVWRLVQSDSDDDVLASAVADADDTDNLDPLVKKICFPTSRFRNQPLLIERGRSRRIVVDKVFPPDPVSPSFKGASSQEDPSSSSGARGGWMQSVASTTGGRVELDEDEETIDTTELDFIAFFLSLSWTSSSPQPKQKAYQPSCGTSTTCC